MIPAGVGDFTDAVNEALPLDRSGLAGYTVVCKIHPEEMAAVGNRFRLVVKGPNVSGANIGIEMLAGLVAEEGNAYDFLASSAVQVTFNGSNSFSVNAGEEIQSDEIDFIYDKSHGLLIAFDVDTAAIVPYVAALGDGFITYVSASAATEADSDAKSAGYDAFPGTLFGISIVACA